MNWIAESVFYHIYPLGFCGAPQQNSKDGEITNRIGKLESWIPHLLELGINAVYLGPVFESSEHGYDTRDYYMLDRRLGSNENFKTVCDSLHKNGIRVVLDGVFNHVGREFWAFEDVRQNGQGSPYCGWFQGLNFGGNSPMGDPFWYESWQGYYNLVKLNLKNPDVVSHLLDAVGMWMDEFGIDGLRLDAADCVDMDFFRRLKSYCRAKKPDFWLMGEIIHGDYNRWANPDMLDSVTNYECAKGLYSSHNDKNYFEIAHSLNRQFGRGGIYQSLCLYNFVDNHDVNRLASVLKNPDQLRNVYTLLYTMPGVPSVYYGSEWAVTGTKQNGSDAGLRPCLELGAIPGANDGLCGHIARLGAIRRSLSALQTGSYEQVTVKNEQFVFKRGGEHPVYVALNLSGDPCRLDFPVDEANPRDLLSGGELTVENGMAHVNIASCSAMIITSAPTDTDALRASGTAREAVRTPSPQTSSPQTSSPQTPSPQSIPVLQASSEQTAPQEGAPDTCGCESAQLTQQAPTSDSTPQASSTGNAPLTLGRYRHFKGKEYEVLGTARYSETLEPMVVYRQLYGDFGLWVRPLSMFLETVERDGQIMPRFEYIGFKQQ